MSGRLATAHDVLVGSPLTVLVLTLAAYRIGLAVQARVRHPLAQPVLVAVLLVGGALHLLDLPVARYADGVAPLTLLLGPATVALAVPLHRQAHHLRATGAAVLVGVPLGAVVSVSTAVLAVRLAGGGDELARTLAPKAATTPVSIVVSAENGGIPSLTAALTIAIGILGAVVGPTVLTWLRVHDRRVRGLALGSVSHGIGTSRALAEDPTEGAFAGLAMGLTGLATALAVPLLVPWLLTVG